MIRETAYDEVFDAQTHFRLIMDSMARPGKLNVLNGVAIEPPASLNRASALIGLALLNADVSYYAAENAPGIADYFITNTASRPAEAHEADFLFLPGQSDSDTLEAAKIGTLSYPETNAFVVIDVEAISTEPDTTALALILSGPGVKGEKTVFVRGLNPELLLTICEKNAEYPMGLDAILTDQNDQILCIPRSVKIMSELVIE
jgi:alpha-D-ribose 1-methylphosphonate 5-triphosphate synthase subunit PhnH